MKRPVLIGVGAVAVIIIGAAVFLYSSIDSLVVAAVEKYGSEITGVRVSLAKSNIEAGSGRGTLSGLVVGNPEGFNTDSVFELGSVSVTLDMGSLTGDTIIIKEITIEEPQVTYEMSGGGSNIDAIQHNVDAYMARLGGDNAAEGTDEGPKLVIENLYVRNGTVRVSASLLKGKTLDSSLPDIHLTDIGKEAGGATPGQAVSQVMAAITGSVGKAAAVVDLDGITKKLADTAAKVTDTVKDKVKETAESAKNALKKLFGN